MYKYTLLLLLSVSIVFKSYGQSKRDSVIAEVSSLHIAAHTKRDSIVNLMEGYLQYAQENNDSVLINVISKMYSSSCFEFGEQEKGPTMCFHELHWMTNDSISLSIKQELIEALLLQGEIDKTSLQGSDQFTGNNKNSTQAIKAMQDELKIAKQFLEQELYTKAIIAYNKILNANKAYQYSESYCLVLLELSNAYYHNGGYKESIATARKVINWGVWQKQNSYAESAVFNGVLQKFRVETEIYPYTDYPEKLNNFIALSHFWSGNENLKAILDHTLFHYYVSNELYDKAKPLLNKSNGQPKKAESSIDKHQDLNEFIAQLERQGKDKRELDELSDCLIYYDSLNSYNTITRAKAFEALLKVTAFESERQMKKMEIDLLNTKQEKLEQNQKLYLLILVICILLIAVAGGFIYTAKKNEKRLKDLNKLINKQVETLERNYRNREILIGDMHHRVKNNYQIVSTYLQGQVEESFDKNQLNTFVAKIQGKLLAMSEIHTQLYQRENLDKVKIKAFFEELVPQLISSFKTNKNNINLHTSITDIYLPLNVVTPLALFVQEAICNSVIHAYANNTEGNIYITIRLEKKSLCVQIKDDGKGSAVDMDNQGFGIRLLYLFAKQLNGEVAINTKNGEGVLVELNIHNVL